MTIAAHHTTSDPVLQWAGYAQIAHKRYPDIPVPVLLGLTRVESGGHAGETSSANAQGITQFIRSTAAKYHVDVRPGHELSQLVGTAHYLHDLGYAHDPRRALNAYNGAQTIGGQPNPYASNVLGAARSYGHVDTTVTPAPPGTHAAGTDAGGDPLDAHKKSQALSALLTVALVVGGAGLIYTGLNLSSGGRLHGAVQRTGAVQRASSAGRPPGASKGAGGFARRAGASEGEADVIGAAAVPAEAAEAGAVVAA